ncbi:MAG TPA: 50S ribosomal protein L4 [Patescibacteria group bacterium]|nr:50S ribosomal protein L4 [Patescibacteria group bacterium]
MKIKVYNLHGESVEDFELSDNVFNVPVNNDLIHQVAVAISANMRPVLAHTKTRGERAGSGKKPWKQKGTGRARVGSVRTPVWRKGGVSFGPRKDRNFKKKVNKKMNARAIAMTLSGKNRDKELIIIDKIKLEQKKTKIMAEALKKLKIKGSALFVFSDGEKDCRLASRNISKVKNILTSQLNVLDMINSKYLVMSKDSAKLLEEKYGK